MDGYPLLAFFGLFVIVASLAMFFFFRAREAKSAMEHERRLAEERNRFQRQEVERLRQDNVRELELAEARMAQSRAADAAQIRSLEAIAYVDPKTGLYNEFGGDRTLRLTVGNVLRADVACVTVLYADLNGFKEVNDRFGHDQGDKAIALTAEAIMRTLLRQGDFAIRPHGDEFVVVLPYTAHESAREVIRRLDQAIRRIEFFPTEEARVHLSLSVGGATLVVENDTAYLGPHTWNLRERNGSAFVGEVVDALTKAADREMFRAKGYAHPKNPPGVTFSLNEIVPARETGPPMEVSAELRAAISSVRLLPQPADPPTPVGTRRAGSNS